MSNDNDEFIDADYGKCVGKMPLEDMKEIIHSKSNAHTVIDYPYKGFVFDIAVLEDNKPILDVHVKNHKWDSGKFGLMSTNQYSPTDRIEKLSTKCNIPLYVCRSKKRIDETIRFIKLWTNKEFNELYKLYPNKIKTINFLR